MPVSSSGAPPGPCWKAVWLYAGVGRSVNICLRGERRSVEEAGEWRVAEDVGVDDSDRGSSSPKIRCCSSTKREMSGPGTFNVGEKTTPTMKS